LNFSKLNLTSPGFEQEKSPQIAISPFPEANGVKKRFKYNNPMPRDDSNNSSITHTHDSSDLLNPNNYRKQSYDSVNVGNSTYSISSPLRIKTRYGNGNEPNIHTPLSSALVSVNNNNLYSATSHKSYISLNTGVYNTLIYGERDSDCEPDIEGFISPVNAEYMYTFSPRNFNNDNSDTISFTSKISKVTYTNQSICTPTNISLTDNCPYECSDDIKGLDEIIDFITKKFLRVDEEMHFFISNLKAFKEKQVILILINIINNYKKYLIRII